MSGRLHPAPEPAPTDLDLARARRGEVVHAPQGPSMFAVCTTAIEADHPSVARRVGANEWDRAITCPDCMEAMRVLGWGRPPRGLARWVQLRWRSLVLRLHGWRGGCAGERLGKSS